MDLMKPEENAKESASLELISQVFGPTIGFFTIGDPTGISAAAISVIAKWGLDRFIPLLISQKQTERLYVWGKQASEGIAQRLEYDEKFRMDGFFEKTPTNRSNMDEAVESTLKKVIDTTEEPKIKFMANLTENVHFDPDLDIDTYRRLLKHLEELSYRQLCIIKLFMNADQIDSDNFGNPHVRHNLSSILTDCFEVRDKGLISPNNALMKKIRDLYLGTVSTSLWNNADKPPQFPGFVNSVGFSNILGENLFKFAKLEQIPDEDVASILRELKNG